MNRPSVNWQERYRASLIITVRVRTRDVPGNLGNLLSTVGKLNTPIGDVRMVDVASHYKTREIQMFFSDQAHMDRTLSAINELSDVELVSVTDQVLQMHRGGTIETKSRSPLRTLMDLSLIHTPGVASICEMIQERPAAAWEYTGRGHRIALATNGTNVGGLGNIGLLPSLPLIEGKASILAEFVNISASPVLVDSTDASEIANVLRMSAPTYGAIQLESMDPATARATAAELQGQVGIPVLVGDGRARTAVIVAAFINAVGQTGRDFGSTHAVVSGADEAGRELAELLLEVGVADVIVCDGRGALLEGRDDMDELATSIASRTNRNRKEGSVDDVAGGADVLIDVAETHAMTAQTVQSMAEDPIVFGLTSRDISVADALEAGAALAVDGQGLNQTLAYPGILRGALDARAQRITPAMILAAARAIAESAAEDNLLPDTFDGALHRRVAEAVQAAWAEQ